MKKEFWERKSEANITIKLNDLCNTKCLHCFSNGSDRSYLNIPSLKNEFSELFLQMYQKGIRKYDISFVGGEFTLIPEKKLKFVFDSFNESILNFLNTIFDEKSVSEKDNVSFIISYISNFIFDIKPTNYSELLYSITQTEWNNPNYNPHADKSKFKIEMFTSFDYGLERFKSDKIEALWKNNCKKFKGNLGVLVTLNKETCNRIEEIINDPFFDIFENIIFQPMLDFSDKEYLTPTYSELYRAINYIKNIKHSDKYNLGTKLDVRYFISINNDSVLSCCVSEEVKLYNNKPHFPLTDIFNQKDLLSETLDKQLQIRIKKALNKHCLSCDQYSTCNFGYELFTKEIICPNFYLQPK